MDRKLKVQFIVKYREAEWCIDGDDSDNCYSTTGSMSSGLSNSASFVCKALNNTGLIDAELVQVIDNNFIDKEVSRFKPDIVIIEAYWVVPEKFDILTKLYPHVKWIVINHSEIPFAAQEGIVIQWSLDYLKYPNVFISGNSKRSYKDFEVLVKSAFPYDFNPVLYLPNIYPTKHRKTFTPKQENEYLDIACFGAIRPLKNHLMQAVAAIKFANHKGKSLRFHINGGRVEGGAVSNNILKNLRMLFDRLPEHNLVEHGWYPHEQFLDVLEGMDMGLQVSFSETFNIVGADMAHVGLPIVCSKEVLWAPSHVCADPTSSKDIYNKMCFIWAIKNWRIHQLLCQWSLNCYSAESLAQWFVELDRLTD
jgi:hypothetical protein